MKTFRSPGGEDFDNRMVNRVANKVGGGAGELVLKFSAGPRIF